MTWLWWALLSAVFAAATAILAKLGVTGVDPNLATAVRTTVVVLFAWMIALSLGSHTGLAHIERRSWLFSRCLRPGDRLVMDLLFPGALARRGFEGGTDRQAERRLRYPSGWTSAR